MIGFQHWPKATGLLDFLKSSSTHFNEVGCTPYKVIEQLGSITLRRYGPSHSQQALLMIPSFINRSYILDLLPEKSLIQNYLNQGQTVYLIDWGIPDEFENHITVEDLFSLYLDLIVKRVQEDSEATDFHLVGHCLGGTLATILAVLQPDAIKSLILWTTPIDFNSDEKINTWVKNKIFDIDAFVSAEGSAPWALLQSSFLALKPLQSIHKLQQWKQKSSDPKFVKNFMAMECWSNDNVNVRGQWYQFLIQQLYQRNDLAQGHLIISDQKIDLAKLNCPILVLKAKEDHIVAKSSHLDPRTTPKVKQFKTIDIPGGHVGALIGGYSIKNIWPEMNHWMKQIN